MGIYSCKSFLWTTSRVLKVLSVYSSNKRAIIATGGFQILARQLNNSMPNLSDAAAKQGNIRPVLPRLAQLLGSSKKSIVSCITGILSNLTCNNSHNKVIVCRENGIGALTNILKAKKRRHRRTCYLHSSPLDMSAS
ncbi:Catenin beta [Araneus ventricosus]|uniref:Armadillo segment polarity protein n=1 Tax=Araneus ventricosus TaxID=182803 RepID=A0A4Y2WEV4_ARAVE|nr:Catenin beta [Araneus ventricosus]